MAEDAAHNHDQAGRIFDQAPVLLGVSLVSHSIDGHGALDQLDDRRQMARVHLGLIVLSLLVLLI